MSPETSFYWLVLGFCCTYCIWQCLLMIWKYDGTDVSIVVNCRCDKVFMIFFFFFFFSWRVSCFLISLMYLFWCTCDKLFIMTKVSFFPVCVSDFLELNIHLCDLSFPHECHFLFKSCKFLVYGINVVTTMYLGHHDFYQRSHVHTFLSVIFITFKICVQV